MVVYTRRGWVTTNLIFHFLFRIIILRKQLSSMLMSALDKNVYLVKL
jgi:hypothetical protein